MEICRRSVEFSIHGRLQGLQVNTRSYRGAKSARAQRSCCESGTSSRAELRGFVGSIGLKQLGIGRGEARTGEGRLEWVPHERRSQPHQPRKRGRRRLLPARSILDHFAQTLDRARLAQALLKELIAPTAGAAFVLLSYWGNRPAINDFGTIVARRPIRP